MRILLLLVTLTAGLAACSDDGGGQPEEAASGSADSAESTESGQAQDSTPSGQNPSAKQGLEAGQPVTRPTPPEQVSAGDAQGKGSDDAGGDDGPASTEPTEADQNTDKAERRVAAAEIYDRYCVACHEKGMAGAPKLANTAAWQDRLEKRGLKGLAKNSWQGYRAMPAKGTCSSCSREELEATVEWMLDQAKVSF
jgi:cytochrome c5